MSTTTISDERVDENAVDEDRSSLPPLTDDLVRHIEQLAEHAAHEYGYGDLDARQITLIAKHEAIQCFTASSRTSELAYPLQRRWKFRHEAIDLFLCAFARSHVAERDRMAAL
jgi:hypothetical protein